MLPPPAPCAVRPFLALSMATSLFISPSEALPGDSADPRRPALIASLRSRYAAAELRQDAAAKQELFREAVYLGIRPEDFTPPG